MYVQGLPEFLDCSLGKITTIKYNLDIEAQTHQWQTLRGTTWENILGGNQKHLKFNPRQVDHLKFFRVIINTPKGIITTLPTQLRVYSLTLEQGPSPQEANIGGVAVFTSHAVGNPPPSCAWVKSVDGNSWENIPDETGETLTLSNIKLTDNNTLYRSVYSNMETTVMSNPARLSIRYIQIESHPTDTFGQINGQAEFKVSAVGYPKPLYQWYRKDSNEEYLIVSANNSHLLLKNLSIEELNCEYFCRISNMSGEVKSSSGKLLANPYIQWNLLKNDEGFTGHGWEWGKNGWVSSGGYLDSGEIFIQVEGNYHCELYHEMVNSNGLVFVRKLSSSQEYFYVDKSKFIENGYNSIHQEGEYAGLPCWSGQHTYESKFSLGYFHVGDKINVRLIGNGEWKIFGVSVTFKQ